MDIVKTLNRFKGSFFFFDALMPKMKPMKAYVNWLLANYEMWRQVDAVQAQPLKLTIEPTNICQLHCPLCPTGLRINDRNFCYLNIDIFKRLLDEVGDYVFFVDFFNWGEPFLNKQLEDFLRLLHEKNISTSLSTNLSVKLSDERIQRFIESGVNHMIVSLDGASQESYATYRRGGNFELVCDNLRRIVQMREKLASKTPYITWQYLIFSFNEHEIDRAQQIAQDIGVDRIFFHKAYIDEGHYDIPENDRAQIRKWVPANPAYTHYDPQDKEKHFSIPLRAKDKYRNKRCDWHYISSAINADGTISPCCAVYKKCNDLGCLNQDHENSYMEQINTRIFKDIRNGFAGRGRLPKEVACSTCTNGSLMEYAKGVNRWIFITTAVRLLSFLTVPVGYVAGKPKRPRLRIKWPD